MKNNHYLASLVIYGTAILLLMLVQVLVSLGCFNGLSDQAMEIIGSILPQLIIMLGIPCLMVLGTQKIKHEPISLKQVNSWVNWRRISLKNICLCFLLGVCLFVLNNFIANCFYMILQSFGWQSNYVADDIVFPGYQGLVIALILTAVLPGICEEFLHRGVLLNGLIKQFGVRRALIWTSLMFGLMHMNVGQFFYASILGWFMGVAVLASGSLWGSVIIHFTNNALATYFSYAQTIYLPGMKVLTSLSSVFSFVLILVAFFVIGEVIRVMARDKFKRNIDSYTVRYLASQSQFTVEDFDRLKATLPGALQTLTTWKATAAYIETFDQSKRSTPLEKALLTFITLIGTAVTILTFIWGTW